jgi:hypothetical protein
LQEGNRQKLVLNSAAEECGAWICTHVTLRLSHVGGKKEEVEEASAKSEIKLEEAYIKGKAEKCIYRDPSKNQAHMLSYELTTWIRVLLDTPPVAQLLKNFPIFYGNRRFITVFTRAPPPLIPVPSQINHVHTIPSYFSKIYLNVILPPTSRSS